MRIAKPALVSAGLAAAAVLRASPGTYTRTVTSPKTTAARIRVTWAGNTAVSDISNVNFKIN